MMSLSRFLAVVLAVVLAATSLGLSPLAAQDVTPTLTITAQGQVAVAPDMAVISVGVEVQAAKADKALKQSSARMKQVFTLLERRNIATRDIRTSQFSLRPQWREQKSSYDQPLEIAGFAVTNVVTVRIRDLSILGPVLDELTRAGANRVQSVRFSISDPVPLKDVARKRAVAEAMRRARLIAQAAGVRLGDILSIRNSGTSAAPAFRALGAQATSAVPMSEGELIVGEEVTIVFTLD